MKFTPKTRKRAPRVLAAVVVAAISALMLLAAPAFAASSAQQGYSTPGEKIQTSFDPHGSLPFTGLDVVTILAVATVLLVAGFGIRRLARTSR